MDNRLLATPNGVNKVTIRVANGAGPYVLPPATNTTLGGVKIPDGGNLAVDAGGNLTVTGLGGNYVENQSQYGNLTVTDSVAFSGGLQCELSAPSFGEKIIHYALNGGARTDWLANTTVEGGYYGASMVASAAGAAFQKTTFSSYPNNATYTQIQLTDTDALLNLNRIGSETAKTKVWTPNSILTQGYADTRYLPLLANVTSNSTIPIKTTAGSNQTVSGVSFAGVGLGLPYTGVSGFAASGAYIAETYKGTDATAANQFGTLSIGFSSVSLLSRILDTGSVHGLESMGASATGTRLINRTTGNATGMINLNSGTTAFPAMSDSGKGFTALMHAGNGVELTADSMNIGICANSTHGTAELRYGANLTAVHNANSILTQGYADTRYTPLIKSSGSLYANAGKLYLNTADVDPDVFYTCAMSAALELVNETIMAQGRYTVRILNLMGSPLTIGAGIFKPVGFNALNDLGQQSGSVTILEFVVYDDKPSILFLTNWRVY